MSTRRTSRAAQQLSDRLRAEDVDVSPREIERWRQEYGLIAPSIRRWIPRGGSESVYPDEAALQARQVRSLLDQGLDLADVVAVQWLRGNYVETSHLRRVLITKIRERFGPPEKSANWLDAKPRADAQAHQLAKTLAREEAAKPLRQALHQTGRREGERINETVARLLSTVFLIFHAGEPYTREELALFIAAIGVPSDFRDTDAIVTQLPNIRQAELEKLVEQATRQELDRAVNDHKVLGELARALGVQLVDNLEEQEMVVEVVGVLAMRKSFGEDFARVIVEIKDAMSNQGEATP